MVTVKLPLRIQSEANTRSHWREKAQRTKHHRQTARLLMAVEAGDPPEGRICITLTRIGPRTLDDDNLAGGFKACRDGVADWLGIDDGSKALSWVYDQRKGSPNEYAAEVRVEVVA